MEPSVYFSILGISYASYYLIIISVDWIKKKRYKVEGSNKESFELTFDDQEAKEVNDIEVSPELVEHIEKKND